MTEEKEQIEQTEVEEEKQEIEVLKPVEVELCPYCKLPLEYCEYGPNASKCKKAKGEGETKEEKKEGEAEKKEEGEAEAEEKKVEPKKEDKKKKEEKFITITNVKRNKKQSITKVTGVSLFGLDPKEVAHFIGKKYSVGSNVDKKTGIDCVNVQGDFQADIADILVEHFKVPRQNIKL